MVVSDVGYWKSASQQRSGHIFPLRVGKMAPVVEVDDPEAEAILRENYPWENPIIIRPDDLSSYWAKPKLAPVVEVRSQEEEEILKSQFPYDHPTYVRSMGAFEDVKKRLPVFIGASLASILVGYVGWHIRGKLPTLSPFLIGAAGSILGAVVYDVVQELHR